MTLFPRIKQLLAENGADDIMVMGGGTIPEEDVKELKNGGWTEEIFTPGTTIEDIVEWINKKCKGGLKPGRLLENLWNMLFSFFKKALPLGGACPLSDYVSLFNCLKLFQP